MLIYYQLWKQLRSLLLFFIIITCDNFLGFFDELKKKNALI